MTKRPWRSHYTRDWANDPFVRGLELDARMVYFELLDIAWDEEGLRIEWLLTGKYVAHRIGISRRRFLTLWDSVRFKFEEISPGLWANQRLETERDRADKHSEKQSNNAKQKKHVSAKAKPPGEKLAQHSESESESEQKKQIEPSADRSDSFDFEKVYLASPCKGGKAKGIEALRKTVKSRDLYDAILAAATAYGDDERRFKAGGSKDFRPAVPYFSTWANQRRWEDYTEEPLLTLVTGGSSGSPMLDEIRQREAKERGFANHAERKAAEEAEMLAAKRPA